jgi:hypothetical protein
VAPFLKDGTSGIETIQLVSHGVIKCKIVVRDAVVGDDDSNSLAPLEAQQARRVESKYYTFTMCSIVCNNVFDSYFPLCHFSRKQEHDD